MKLSIQFCGGCNPRIDRGNIARELQKAGTDIGLDVVLNSPDADITVFLSGCLSGCALKYNPHDPPYVEVAAATVDGIDVPEERIVAEVMMKVRQMHDRLEAEICQKNRERRDGA